MKIIKLFSEKKCYPIIRWNVKVNKIERENSHGINYVNNRTFIEIMGISASTAQKWRSRGILPYSKFSGRVYYDVNDFNEMLHKCQIKPFVDKA